MHSGLHLILMDILKLHILKYYLKQFNDITVKTTISQSINQISTAPVSPVKSGSLVLQPMGVQQQN